MQNAKINHLVMKDTIRTNTTTIVTQPATERKPLVSNNLQA